MQFLELFENWANKEEFDARAVIFHENEPADILYVILDGEVELTFHDTSLGVEKRGGIIGAMAVITRGTRNATATTLTQVRAARMTRKEFRTLIDRDSGFAYHAMATLANRLRAVDNFIRDQLDSKA